VVLKGIFKTKAIVWLTSAKKIRRILSFCFKTESEVVSNAFVSKWTLSKQ